MSDLLVTGGVGFIGANLSDHLLQLGHRVTVLDNFSRPGVTRNEEWLRERHGDRLRIVRGDVSDLQAVEAAVRDAEGIFHLAGQVAVTTSLVQPLQDFASNLQGTVHVLDAARRSPRHPAVVYASTNKVYGGLSWLAVSEGETRYAFADGRPGVDEGAPLEFQTPYACSKGGGDQYVLTYGKVYDVPTVVLRMSCIYGERQFGTEDQGWVAHFVAKALCGKKIMIYGNGKQVRDILHVSDVVRAYETAGRRARELSGQAFNVGGGPRNAVSLLELMDALEGKLGRAVDREFMPWREGDQPLFIANVGRAKEVLGWEPTVSVDQGLDRMVAYTQTHLDWFR